MTSFLDPPSGHVSGPPLGAAPRGSAPGPWRTCAKQRVQPAGGRAAVSCPVGELLEGGGKAALPLSTAPCPGVPFCPVLGALRPRPRLSAASAVRARRTVRQERLPPTAPRRPTQPPCE